MVNIGDKLLIKVGNKGKMVSFTSYGKVIIVNGDNIKPGYVEVLEAEEREKCYIVKAKNIIYDTYADMSYASFLEILKVNNFKIGFILPFKYEGKTESQIFAYNMETGILINAETFDNRKTFNEIAVYVPNVDGLKLGTRVKGLVQSSCDMAVFDIANKDNVTLKWLVGFAKTKQNTNKNIWQENCTPQLWNYADRLEDYSGDEYLGMYSGKHKFGLWNATIGKILLADKEIEKLFTSEVMQEVFKTRK